MEHSTITINVKTLDSKTFPLTIPTNITVAELKKYLKDATTIPEEQQRLIFQGKALKDKDPISLYSLKDGSTIHMVPRPPGTTPSQPPQQRTPSTSQTTSTTTTSTTSTGTNTTPQPRNFVAPNIMLGTISVPDGTPPPDINQLLGNVFTSMGLPNVIPPTNQTQPSSGNPPLQQQQTPPQPAEDPTRRLRDALNHLNSGINALSSIPTTSITPATNANPNTVENVGHFLSQLSAASASLHPYITRLSSLLQQESTLQLPAARDETQQLASQLFPLMQQLGSLLLLFSNTLASLRMGTTAGSGRTDPPSALHRHVMTPGNIAIQIHTDPNGQPVTPTIPNTVPMSIPMISITPRSNTTPNSTNVNLLSMMAQQMQRNRNTQNAPSQSSTPPPPPQQIPMNQMQNLLQNVMQTVTPLMQQFAQQGRPNVPPTNNNRQPQSSTTQGKNVIGVTEYTATQMPSPQQQPASPPVSSSTTSQLSSASRTINNNNTSGAVQVTTTTSGNSAALMSQTLNVVTQAMSGSQPTSVSSVIGTIAQGMGSTPEEREDSVLSEILQRTLDTLTLPDMMQIMAGNWAPLQRVHPALQNYVKELLGNDMSQQKILSLVNEIMDSMNDSLNEKNLPPDFKSKVKPGFELTSIAKSTLRKHITNLITLLLTPFPPSTTNPFPFAVAVKEWTSSFVGELVTNMSQALTGGVPDAANVIKFFLQDRLAFMGPEFAQVGTHMITSYIIKTYTQTIETSDPSTWSSTIQVDEIRQSNTPPQRPPSDSYSSGSSAKRRKAARLINLNPSLLFHDRLREALKNVRGGTSQENVLQAASHAGLQASYQAMLTQDISQRLLSDPDFQKDKFPHSASLL